MKSLIHRTFARTLAFGALSFGLFGSVLTATPALALSEEQIAQQRATVLAYVVEGENGPVYSEDTELGLINLLAFMSAQSARNFIESSGENAASLEVVPTNLERIHQAIEQADDDSLRIALIPEEAEVQQALAVDADYEGGVPLFFAQFEDGSLLPLQQGGEGEPIFPMFFSRADLDESLTGLAETAPDVYAEISVGVVPLPVVLNRITTSDDELLSRIRMLPADVVDAIRQNSGESAN
ncbi:MAG: Tic22 family protein [Cyanobacteria bacterium J06649_4]